MITLTTQGLIFSDDFNRADGAPGSNYTIPAGGTAAIVSNRLRLTGSGSEWLPNVSIIPTMSEMYVQQLISVFSSGAELGMMPRYNGGHYLVQFYGTNLNLYRSSGYTFVTSTSFSPVTGQQYNCQIYVAPSGEQKIWVDSLLKISASDSAAGSSAGRYAFRSTIAGASMEVDSLFIFSSNRVSVTGLPSGYKARAGGVTATESSGTATINVGGITAPFALLEVLDASNVVIDSLSATINPGSIYSYVASAVLSGTTGSSLTLTGSLSVTAALGGGLNSSVQLSGELEVLVQLGGASTTAVGIAAVLSVAYQLGGTLASSVTLAGELDSQFFFTGVLDTTSTLIGSLKVLLGWNTCLDADIAFDECSDSAPEGEPLPDIGGIGLPSVVAFEFSDLPEGQVAGAEHFGLGTSEITGGVLLNNELGSLEIGGLIADRDQVPGNQRALATLRMKTVVAGTNSAGGLVLRHNYSPFSGFRILAVYIHAAVPDNAALSLTAYGSLDVGAISSESFSSGGFLDDNDLITIEAEYIPEEDILKLRAWPLASGAPTPVDVSVGVGYRTIMGSAGLVDQGRAFLGDSNTEWIYLETEQSYPAPPTPVQFLTPTSGELDTWEVPVVWTPSVSTLTIHYEIYYSLDGESFFLISENINSVGVTWITPFVTRGRPVVLAIRAVDELGQASTWGYSGVIVPPVWELCVSPGGEWIEC